MKPASFWKKVLLTLLIALLVPSIVSIYLVSQLLDESLSIGLNPRIKESLTRSLSTYKELFKTQKQLYTSIGSQIASDPELAEAVAAGDFKSMTKSASIAVSQHKEIVSVTLEKDGTQTRLFSGPATGETTRTFTVDMPVSRPGNGVFKISFAPPHSQFSDMAEAQQTLDIYGRIAGIKLKIARSLAIAYLIVLGAVVIFVLFIGVYRARQFIKPLYELASATERVRKGDLDFKVSVQSGDEIGMLAESFNRMVRELKENRDRIIYLEKVSSWQEIARRLAHEIKNPLTPINLAMQQVHAKYRGDDEEYHRLLDQSKEIVEEEIAALKRMVDAFSSFAKLPSVKLEAAGLDPFVEDFLTSNNRFAPLAKIDFLPGAHASMAKLDRVLFKRVLENLVRNAIEAAGQDARIIIRTGSGDGLVTLTVEDSGPGIPQDILPRIFNPYFTTKTDGTGLGLPIARKIVIDHGGEIVAENLYAGGARFRITLPAQIET